MQPPEHRGYDGSPEPRERSDLFSVPRERESLIPQLTSVPETPEERRRRKIVRIVTALIAIAIVVTAVLIYLSIAHSAAVEEAATAAGADARPAHLTEGLSLLEGDDAPEDVALRARLRAISAFEHGVTSDAEQAKQLLASIEGSDAGQSLNARVARTYLALAEARSAEAAQHVTGLAFVGPYAAEAAHAAALAGLSVGDVQHAVDTSAGAIEKNPEGPRYVALRARVLARAGQVDEALALLEGLPEEARLSPSAQLAHARILVHARRDLERAASEARSVIEADAAGPTEKAWAHLVLARVTALAKDPVTARAELASAIEARPPGDEAFTLDVLETLLDVHAPARAAAEQEHLPTDVSTDPSRRAQLTARLALDRRQLEAAQGALERAPDGAGTTLLRARFAQAKGEHDRARTLYGEAASDPLVAVEASWRLGAMELDLERFDEALAAAGQALELAAADPDAVPVAARAHVAKGAPDEGMALVMEALAQHPEDPRLLAAKASVEMATEQWSDARATLRAAVERDGEDAELWAQLGEAARNVGEAEEAQSSFERALELEEEQPLALVGLLKLAVAAEDVESAEQALARVQEADITSIEVDRPEARYYVLSGAGHRATDEVRRAVIRRGPQDAFLWKQLAILQYQAEIFDGAARSFARAMGHLEEGEVDLEARLGLALAQIAMRSTSAAEKTLENAQTDAEGRDELTTYEQALHLATQARYQLAEDRLGAARNLARRALELDPDNWVAHEVVADVLDERNGDPTSHLRDAAAGVPPSISAAGRLALRAEELSDQVCEWAESYRQAAPSGRHGRRVNQVVRDCRRR